MFHMAIENPKPRRMKLARVMRGLTQREVAEAAGMAENSISRYESGSRIPKASSLRMLAHVYGKPVEWFYDEEEEAQGPVNPNAEAPEPETHSETEPLGVITSLNEIGRAFSARFDRLESAVRAMVIAEPRAEYDTGGESPMRDPVDVNEVAAAAGGGAVVFDETVVGRLWFRRDWLDRHAIDPKQCNIITVRGESMEPTLPHGCSILVDRSQGRRRRREGRIFVIRTEDGLVVKRAGKDAEGNWQIESDNEDWEPVPWSRDTEIIGEVRWAARTF